MSGIFGFNVGAVISLGDLEKSIQLIEETEEEYENIGGETESTEQIDRIESRFKLKDLPTPPDKQRKNIDETEIVAEATQDIFKELEEDYGEVEVSEVGKEFEDGDEEFDDGDEEFDDGDEEFDDEDFGEFFQDDEDFGEFFQDDEDFGDFFQDDEGDWEDEDGEDETEVIQTTPREVQADNENGGEELEEDEDNYEDFFQDDEEDEDDFGDFFQDDEEDQEEHQEISVGSGEDIGVTPEEELKALVEEKTESNKDNELEELKKQLENERRLREKAEQEKERLLNGKESNTSQTRTLTPEQIAKIRKIKQLREAKKLKEERRLAEETKPKERKLDNSIYDSLDVEALYTEVKEFMLRSDISKGAMDVKILRDKFGPNNIKKLITKSYLISIGKGVTIGK